MRRARAYSGLKRTFTTIANASRLDAALRGRRRIVRPLTAALVGANGGVGRTLCTAGVGALIAQRSSLRVLAIDAGHRRGTLPLLLREPLRSEEDAGGLLQALDEVSSATALRRFISTHVSGLDVLTGPVPPDGLRPLVFFCQRYYDLVLLDTSGELGSSRVEAPLSCARAIVVTTPEWPAVTLAAEALREHDAVAGVVLNRVSDRVGAELAQNLLADRSRRPAWTLRDDRKLAQMVNSGALGIASLRNKTRINLLQIANGVLDRVAPSASSS